MTAGKSRAGVGTTVAALVAGVADRLQGTMAGADPRIATELASDLVAAIVGRPRSWPFTHSDAPAGERLQADTLAAADRLVRGMPFAYAVGRASFRHLELDVDWRVLIPRPETELLVELVLASTQAVPGATVVDVGTGSGAVALALATERRFSRVIATDVSLDALAVARKNLDRHRAQLLAEVELRPGDALTPVAGELVDIVVSNPPYIAFGELSQLPPLVRDWEPPQALVCGDDGLSMTRDLVDGAGRVLRPGGLLALEVDSRRAREVQSMMQRHGGWPVVAIHRDLTGRERFVMASSAVEP